MYHKNGKPIYVEISANMLVDKNNKIVIIGSTRDIKDRKMRELNYEAINKHLKIATDTVDEAIWMIGIEELYETINSNDKLDNNLVDRFRYLRYS